MRIEQQMGTPGFDLGLDDLIKGHVYIEAGRETIPFIFTDESEAVDLVDGTQWTPDDSERYRELPAKVVIE